MAVAAAFSGADASGPLHTFDIVEPPNGTEAVPDGAGTTSAGASVNDGNYVPQIIHVNAIGSPARSTEHRI